MILFV